MKLKHVLIIGVSALICVLTVRAEEPKILSIGAAETCGSIGRIPSIATDSKNQPHIVADWGTEAIMYDRISGAWRFSRFNSGNYGSSQFYNPSLIIDTVNDRSYCGGILFGGLVGVGVITRTDMANNPSAPSFTRIRLQGEWDVGNLSWDPAFPNQFVVYGANGAWKIMEYAPGAPGSIQMVSKGTMYAGQGGEKNQLEVSRAGSVLHPNGESHGVWHAATGGWDGYSSAYQNSLRAAQSLGPVTWLYFRCYPKQNNDGTYVDVSGDNKDPNIAYMTCGYPGEGVVMNIWDGNKGSMVFNACGGLTIDAAGDWGMRRYQPQLAPAKNGGVFILWHSSGRIKVRYVSQTGQMGTVYDIGAGNLGAICADKQGNLHVAYGSGAGITYRKLLVSGAGSAVTKAGNFGGDSKDDLALFDPATANWYIQDMANSNKIKWAYQFGNLGDLPVPADYDGDGICDLGVFNPVDNTWYVQTMTGTNLVWGTTFGVEGCIPVPADYNGDGKAELGYVDATTYTWYSKNVSEVSIFNGISSVTAGITVPVDLNGMQLGAAGMTPVPADYNGDTKAELGVFNASDGLWYILTTTSNLVVWGESISPAGCIPMPGDYDGDGSDDMAVFNPSINMWYFRKATAHTTLPQVRQWGYSGVTPIHGKYDDGLSDDIGVYDSSHGLWYIQASDGTKTNSFAKQWGFAGAQPGTGDFNADQLGDIGVYNNGNWYLHTPWSAQNIAMSTNWGYTGTTAVPADFDGEGHDELAIWDPLTGCWYIRTLTGTVLAWARQWGFPGAWPVPADFNGDKHADLTVYNPQNGNWFIQNMTNTESLAWNSNWGFKGAIPVPADYNGDTNSELAVFNLNNGNWYIKTMSNETIAWATNWGFRGCWPLAKDYNGDGKADLAVYHLSSGIWYIRTLAGTVLEWNRIWGFSGALPFATDFNSDGKADLLVCDATTFWWYGQSLSETFGTIAWARQWGAPGFQPMGGPAN